MGDNMVGKSVSLIFISCLQSSNDEGGLIFRNFCLATVNTDILVHKDECIKSTTHAEFYYQKTLFWSKSYNIQWNMLIKVKEVLC